MSRLLKSNEKPAQHVVPKGSYIIKFKKGVTTEQADDLYKKISDAGASHHTLSLSFVVCVFGGADCYCFLSDTKAARYRKSSMTTRVCISLTVYYRENTFSNHVDRASAFLQTTLFPSPVVLFQRIVMPRATAVLPESFAQQLNSTLQAGDHEIIEYIGTSTRVCAHHIHI